MMESALPLLAQDVTACYRHPACRAVITHGACGDAAVRATSYATALHCPLHMRPVSTCTEYNDTGGWLQETHGNWQFNSCPMHQIRWAVPIE